MLQVQNLYICRGEGHSAFHIHLPILQLNDSEIITIRGASGCGKSTLLEILGLILTPHQLDSYRLGQGSNVQQIAPFILNQEENTLAQLRAQYFGFMLQSGGLLPFLTVQQNMALSCKILGKPLDQAWLDYLIAQLNVGHLLAHYPKQLSIGERQRVSFIRSVAHKPTVLLADEPTAALDPRNAQKLFELIVKLVQDNHLSAIIVTHDWELLKDYSFPSLCADVQGQHANFLLQG